MSEDSSPVEVIALCFSPKARSIVNKLVRKWKMQDLFEGLEDASFLSWCIEGWSLNLLSSLSLSQLTFLMQLIPDLSEDSYKLIRIHYENGDSESNGSAFDPFCLHVVNGRKGPWLHYEHPVFGHRKVPEEATKIDDLSEYMEQKRRGLSYHP